MRALTALLLSLVLAIGSMSVALARGQVPMGQAIALCTEAGAVTVVLDATGNPQPMRPHLCPDCLSAATAFTLCGDLDLLPHRAVSRSLAVAHPTCLLVGHARISTHARDPPAAAV